MRKNFPKKFKNNGKYFPKIVDLKWERVYNDAEVVL